eukprot:TRINITY_DN6914_c0_g1_i2.p1 TRINITY_DN6914_c0_g1~~TRINITY_DN6914_c0_g1_i2.p1  ORF type:complete len:624 (-),score=83.78 TRINITY_DN6914_c0_g1_i2:266-2137(-)
MERMRREPLSEVLCSARFPFYASEMFMYDIRPILEIFFTEMKPFQEERADSAGHQETLSSEVKEEKLSETLEEVKVNLEPASTPITATPENQGLNEFLDNQIMQEVMVSKKESVEESKDGGVVVKKEMKLGKPRILRDLIVRKEENQFEIVKSKIQICARRYEEGKNAVPKKKMPDEEMMDPEDVSSEEVFSSKASTRTDCTTTKPYYFLVEKLLSLLAEPKPLNPVLAGYFAKVIAALMETCGAKLSRYVFQSETCVNSLLSHSYDKSIAEVVIRLVIIDKGKDELLKEKQKVVGRIIEELNPENNPESILNNGYIICVLADTRQHLDYLLSEEALNKLFEYGKAGNPISLRSVLTFFMVLYRLKIMQPESTIDAIETVFNMSSKNKLPDFTHLTDISANYLPYAKACLEATTTVRLPMSSGYSVLPLGLDKLKIIEWLQLLISLRGGLVWSRLAGLNFPGVLLSLMKRYDMNSILQQKVLRAFEAAINTNISAYIETVFALSHPYSSPFGAIWPNGLWSCMRRALECTRTQGEDSGSRFVRSLLVLRTCSLVWESGTSVSASTCSQTAPGSTSRVASCGRCMSRRVSCSGEELIRAGEQERQWKTGLWAEKRKGRIRRSLI